MHFAYGAKQDYIAEFNDPIPQWSAATASGHDSWMGLFCHLEVIFALPIILFTIFRLGIQRKGTSGAHELAMMVYSFEAAFTTLTCMNDVLYWDNRIFPFPLKQKLLTNVYAPFFVIRKCRPLLMVPERPSDLQSVYHLLRHGLPHSRPHQGSGCLADWKEDAVKTTRNRDSEMESLQHAGNVQIHALRTLTSRRARPLLSTVPCLPNRLIFTPSGQMYPNTPHHSYTYASQSTALF